MPRARHSVLAAMLVVVALLVAACGGGGAKKDQRTSASHGDPVSVFTAGADLNTDPAGTLKTLKQLGVDRVRLFLGWNSIAPKPTSAHKPTFAATDPASYPASGWARADTIIRDAKADGIGLDVLIGGPPPLWAAGPGRPKPTHGDPHPYWKPNDKEFGQFVTAVGKRYSGHYKPQGASTPLPRVDFWSIWNEPNIGANLGPETPAPGSPIEVAPRLYRGLLNAAWTSLHKTGHGGDTILIGEIAPAGATFKGAPGLFSVMTPLRFLRALYCANAAYRPLRGTQASERGCPTTAAAAAKFKAQNPALFKASGFADHPYAFTSLPPNERTPHEPDFTTLAAFPTLEKSLDRLQGLYGSHTSLPIWSTEYGYITNPPNPQYTVTPKLAAKYINWAEYISWSDPRIRSYDQYLLRDSSQDFASGLETAAGKKKPAYAAYRMPIWLPVTKAGSGKLEVWGCVRPAKLVKGTPAPVQIQYRPASGGAWKTIAKVSSLSKEGYFDVHEKFPGGGSVRTRWAPPHGRPITSRTVAVTAG